MIAPRTIVSLLTLAAVAVFVADPGCSGRQRAQAQKSDESPASSQAASEPAVTLIDDRQIEEEIAAQVRQLLQGRLGRDVELKGAALADALDVLGDLVNVGLAVRWGALEKIGLDGQTRLSLSLSNPTCGELLRGILEAADPAGRLDYALGLRDQHGRRLAPLCVSSKDDIARLRGAQSQPGS